MDVESESISENSIVPPICSLCQMTPSTESFSYLNGGTVSICGHCKFLLLEDLDTPRDEQRRRRLHRGRRSITGGSSESVEDFFSREFSQMMNLARQNQLLVSEHYDPPHGGGDSDAFSRFFQRTSSRSTPDGSRRWRRMSDTESDGFDNMDSLYGETESNSSFGARNFQGDSFYGGDSDVSLEDDHSFLERGVGFESDSDGSEEADVEISNARYHQSEITSPGSSSTRRTRFLGLEQIIHSRIREERENNPIYNVSRRGPPPTSESFVNSLPRVIINENQKKSNELVPCAVCKDPMLLGSEAIQLPCFHLYHPCCILPWLARRNSCPLCRYELPTDGVDYGVGFRSMNPNPNILNRTEIQQQEESSSSSSSSSSSDDEIYEPIESENVEAGTEMVGNLRNGGRGRWCFLVAAPVVSILGIVIVLWLGNPHQKNQRISTENNQRQNKRWWNWF